MKYWTGLALLTHLKAANMHSLKEFISIFRKLSCGFVLPRIPGKDPSQHKNLKTFSTGHAKAKRLYNLCSKNKYYEPSAIQKKNSQQTKQWSYTAFKGVRQNNGLNIVSTISSPWKPENRLPNATEENQCLSTSLLFSIHFTRQVLCVVHSFQTDKRQHLCCHIGRHGRLALSDKHRQILLFQKPFEETNNCYTVANCRFSWGCYTDSLLLL